MVATNHAVTGALIGLSLGHPVALPLAFASHFVLDAIPHYGDDNKRIATRSFVIQLLIDAAFCGLLVLTLALKGPANWLLAASCAFLAASPDFMWIPKFLHARRGNKEGKSHSSVIRFHTWVQWFQKPIGAVVEVVWLAGSVLLLANIL
jgi:hypothetical protein